MNDDKNSLVKMLRIKYLLHGLSTIFLVIGIFWVKRLISIALIVLGFNCIITSVPLLKIDTIKKSSTIATILCGLIIIFCAIKSML